jgi:hypothetical protein
LSCSKPTRLVERVQSAAILDRRFTSRVTRFIRSELESDQITDVLSP